MADEATIVEESTEETTTETTAESTATTTTETTEKTEVDWRSEWAGEDKELLGFLGRYHSRDAAIKAWKKTNDEIKSGKYRKPLGDDPTEDELAAYRKDFGIPDDPKGYLDNLPDGLVVGKDDEPAVQTFIEKMHAVNAPKAVTEAALSAYYDIVEEMSAAEADAAKAAEQAGVEALREEWGPDYRRNLNAMHNYLDGLPENIKEVFTHGRKADGTPIGYDADVLKFLAGLAMEKNPLATVVPGAGSDAAGAIESELNNLKAMMGDRNSEYWKGPKAEKHQARYRELVEAQSKIK